LETRCGYQYARGCKQSLGGSFQGPSAGHRTRQGAARSAGPTTLSPGKPIPGYQPVNRQRDRLPDLRLASSRIHSALPQCPLPGSGILTGFPFDRRGDHEYHPLPNGVSLSLRGGSLTSKCCSRQTLLHFSLQSSHLNICYYHQDLH
jgi:hypothetical protein